MSSLNTTIDIPLKETIQSILEVFEAPTSVIDHFQLDEIIGDPFIWARSFYKFREMNDTFGLKIKILFGLTALIFVQSIATLIFQFCTCSQTGVRWFFRTRYHSQSKCPYIVPHPVNVIVIASLLTSILISIYLGFAYNAWVLGKLARLIRISSWFPSVWFVYYTAVWYSGFGSFYLTYLVPSQYTRRGSLTGARRYASPVLVNILCFGVPILCATTILPLQVKQANAMLATMKGAAYIYAVLGPLSLAWSGNIDSQETITALKFVDAATANALTAKDTWITYWTAELALWSFWALLALAVAVPFCLSLVLSTHRRIRRMAIAQSGLDRWTTAQVAKQSPPIKQQSSVPPEGSSTDGINCSPADGISFDFSALGLNVNNPRFCSSPVSSFPPSEVQTPNTLEHMHQPFFTFHSPGSFSSKSPSILDRSPNSFSSPALYSSKNPEGKRGSSYGKHSIRALRRMSHSAVFPSRAGMGDTRDRNHLEGLDKRYWHIAAEYFTVLLVMVLLCAFAMFELASQSRMLTDCPRKVLTTMVVTFTYCCLVNAWLSYNLYRLYRDSKTRTTSRSSSSGSISFISEGKRDSTGQTMFDDYSLPQKRPSKSLVHFSNMIRYGSQVEPERRPSSSPSFTIDPANGGVTKHDLQGLRIEIEPRVDAPAGQRPSVTGSTVHQSFERRRSSYRAPSMDLTEALALAPISLHRRCSVQR